MTSVLNSKLEFRMKVMKMRVYVMEWSQNLAYSDNDGNLSVIQG